LHNSLKEENGDKNDFIKSVLRVATIQSKFFDWGFGVAPVVPSVRTQQ
jgi:hypothetical protein